MNNINVNIILKWQHKVFNYYQWTPDGVLYNTKTGRKLKVVENSRCYGYNINGSFVSKTRLKQDKLIELIPEKQTPWD